jgi:hypothetical protein
VRQPVTIFGWKCPTRSGSDGLHNPSTSFSWQPPKPHPEQRSKPEGLVRPPALPSIPMGKRPPVVVVSSSSEEDEGGVRRAASRGPSTRRRRTPAMAQSPALDVSRLRKKPRREGSAGRGRRRASEPAPSSLKVITRSQTRLW